MSGQPLAPTTDERELIALAIQGDRGAFGQLVLRYRDGVVNVIYRMCGDANLAEDAAQEAFVRAWQKLSRYRPQAPFRNWVYRIATNAALDVLRRQRETVELDSVVLPAPADNPEAAIIGRERGERVRRAVLALPDAGRAVLILREYEGLSYREIADTLNIPLGTVMSRLSYARTQLRQMLAAEVEV